MSHNGNGSNGAHRTNARLREIITRERLTRREVSILLHKSITKSGQTPAVSKWLAKPTDAGNYRVMPASDLELLELKIELGHHKKLREAPAHE